MTSMEDKLLIRLSPELKALIIAEADAECVLGGMGEVVVRILAKHFKRPELAKIPRKRLGRKPKRQLESAAK